MVVKAMKTPNSTYWKQRFEAVNEDILNRNAKEMEKHIYNSYTYALNNIEKDIENLISRISKNSGISYSDLKKNLNSKDLKSFRMTLEEYISVAQNKGLSDEWIKRLENASAISRIDRLEMLKIQMSQQLEILAKNKNDIFNSNLSKVYSESYYHSIYEFQKGFGYGNAFATIDTKTINEVLKKPWTSDLKTFSDRIWQDKETLINQLQTTFTQGIIRGAAPEKIIREIQKKAGSSYSASRRLVLTESAAFSSIARCESYKELNVEKYSILATLDLKTSEICRSLEGKEFELSEYETGVTAPPFHPHCRTTTIPAFNDEFTEGEERFARDEEGNGYYVPSDMTFKEWHSKYVIPNIKEPKFIPIRNIDEINDDIIKRLNYEMNLISDNHKDIIKSEVKSIEFVGDESSRYDRKKGILYLRKDFIPGELIHEFGHAIETNLDLYHNQKFLDILENGLEDITPFDIIEDMETFVEPVQRLDVPKFISEYQGFIYEVDTDGNGIILSSGKFNIKSLGEYFSEAYREFYTNPYNLKQKDFNLYKFIEELD